MLGERAPEDGPPIVWEVFGLIIVEAVVAGFLTSSTFWDVVDLLVSIFLVVPIVVEVFFRPVVILDLAFLGDDDGES